MRTRRAAVARCYCEFIPLARIEAASNRREYKLTLDWKNITSSVKCLAKSLDHA